MTAHSGALHGAGMLVIVAGLMLGGCASNDTYKNGPPAIALPAGQTCQTVRAELNRLDARGTPSLIESANAGRKLSPPQREQVDRYNQLLGQYLGARCHA
ncbi:MAG: hypothetical protein AB1749_00430 [Pseudomonadota bacterium]